MTSSAASDTDKARNRTGWPSAVSSPLQPCSTSMPPLPLPPGRCTSSRTTGGLVWRITAMAESTSGASPTMETVVPSSARTPERNMRWSSTRTTSTGFFSGVFTGLLRDGLVVLWFGLGLWRALGRGQGEADLGALFEAPDLRGTSVSLHPPEDRLTDSEPVLRDLTDLEPWPVVAHEGLHPRGSDLEVERYGRGAVAD